MILLSGATGRTGRHLVDFLIGAGIPARAIVRDAAKAEALRVRGVEAVTGDLRDRALVEQAMRGVDRAVATTSGFPDPALCELLGVDPAQAAAIHDAAAAIAAPRGLSWSWTRGADGTTRYLVESQTAG